MVRRRLATVAVVGLGLVSGCANLCNYPVLYRITHPFQRNRDGCDAACGDGPILEDPSATLVPPGGSMPGLSAPLTPEPSVPMLAPPPRLVPQPQAQPTPFRPDQ